MASFLSKNNTTKIKTNPKSRTKNASPCIIIKPGSLDLTMHLNQDKDKTLFSSVKKFFRRTRDVINKDEKVSKGIYSTNKSAMAWWLESAKAGHGGGPEVREEESHSENEGVVLTAESSGGDEGRKKIEGDAGGNGRVQRASIPKVSSSARRLGLDGPILTIPMERSSLSRRGRFRESWKF